MEGKLKKIGKEKKRRVRGSDMPAIKGNTGLCGILLQLVKST